MGKEEKRRKFSFLVTALAGSSVAHYIKLLFRHSICLKYFSRVLMTLLVVMILEPFRWYEELMWRKRIRKTVIDKPPVFIIGFWRSGTTMLHNLLCSAPGMAYVTTYQTVFPHHLLSHSWWFKPIIGQFWPTHRPFDDVKMGLDLPQEEEIALASLQEISFYNFLYFPEDYDKFYQKELFMKDLPAEKLYKWKKEYVKLIRKSILNTGGKQFVSKSPSNMARIKVLLEMFPGARFIYIYRDPYKTVESFYRFFQEVLPVVQIQKTNEELTREKFIHLYSDLNRSYYDHKALIPPQHLLEIKFEDFRSDPLKYLGEIYERFELVGFEDALPLFRKQLDEVSDFRQTSYEISPQSVAWVNKYAADMVDKLGYSRRA